MNPHRHLQLFNLFIYFFSRKCNREFVSIAYHISNVKLFSIIFVFELNKPLSKQQQFILSLLRYILISITDTKNDDVKRKSQKIDFHFNFVIAIITISEMGKAVFLCLLLCVYLYVDTILYKRYKHTLLLNSIIIIMVKKGY